MHLSADGIYSHFALIYANTFNSDVDLQRLRETRVNSSIENHNKLLHESLKIPLKIITNYFMKV